MLELLTFVVRWCNSLLALISAYPFFCSLTCDMTSSIPESFSMDDLEKAMETAPNEELLHATVGCNDDDKELSPEFIEGIAQECLEFASAKCPDPLVHKVMAMMIISRMVDWHKGVAIRQLEEDNLESMGAWMRDAGKFQAVMDILCSIAIGPDDFTCNQ